MNNQLYYGDNLEVLRKYIKDESVDLCYIDPPFNSKRNYNQIYNNIGQEDKAQVQAFIDTWTWDNHANIGLDEILTNYHNKFPRQCISLINGLTEVLGKGSLLAYLVNMTLRITEIQRVLKPTGSFYLHCDPTASHYLKLVLDSIFCSQGGDFRNEIIWGYIAPSAAKKDFPRKHDIIFRYTKSHTFIFNADAIRIPYSEEFIKRRKYSEGKSGIYAEKSLGRDEDNLKGFSKGKIPPSWWTDIKSGGQMPRKEILGYPTQKPEALLERIIKASSNENDLILDAYCGCGTTVAIAQKLNRNWLGIDITYQSISLILKRLEDSFGKEVLTNINLHGIPNDLESAIALANKNDDRVRKEFEKWAVLTYSNNRAVINSKKGKSPLPPLLRGDQERFDGIAYFNGDKGKQEKIIFQVKSGKVGAKDIRDLIGTMTLENASIAIFITLENPSKDMITTAKKTGVYQHEYFNQTYDKIQIVTIKDMIENQQRLNIKLGLEVLKSAEKQTEIKLNQLPLKYD